MNMAVQGSPISKRPPRLELRSRILVEGAMLWAVRGYVAVAHLFEIVLRGFDGQLVGERQGVREGVRGPEEGLPGAVGDVEDVDFAGSVVEDDGFGGHALLRMGGIAACVVVGRDFHKQDLWYVVSSETDFRNVKALVSIANGAQGVRKGLYMLDGG